MRPITPIPNIFIFFQRQTVYDRLYINRTMFRGESISFIITWSEIASPFRFWAVISNNRLAGIVFNSNKVNMSLSSILHVLELFVGRSTEICPVFLVHKCASWIIHNPRSVSSHRLAFTFDALSNNTKYTCIFHIVQRFPTCTIAHMEVLPKKINGCFVQWSNIHKIIVCF